MMTAMLYTNFDISSKEYAIQSVLSRYLSNEDLTGVMILWQDEYKHQPQATLSMFIYNVCDRYGLKFKRTQITGAIFLALSETTLSETKTQTSQSLPKVSATTNPTITPLTLTPGKVTPIATMQEARTITPPNSPLTGNQTSVPLPVLYFSLLALALNARFNGINSYVIQLLKASHKQQTLSVSSTQALIQYYQGASSSTNLQYTTPDQSLLLQKISLETIREITNQLYIQLCNDIGPVKIDAILQQCLRLLESTYPALNIRQIL